MQYSRLSQQGSRISRRKFISACGACSACMATMSFSDLNAFPFNTKGTLTRIRIVFALHAEKQAQPDWPNVGFDFVPFMTRTESELRRKLPDFEFTSSMAKGPEEAAAILHMDGEESIDGYLVYQLNCWNQVVQTLATSGKPVLYADFQYGGSGGFLVYNAGFIRNNQSNIGFIASSDPDELVASVKCFKKVKKEGAGEFRKAVEKLRVKQTPKPRLMECLPDKPDILPVQDCIEELKKSRILAVRDTESKHLEPFMGITVEQISFSVVNEAYNSANRREAAKIAEQWISGARAVVDVDTRIIEDSAAMYLGMKSVLKKYKANAITINCLGGFYGGHIHAYPCLGFHALNNEGLVGACECDLESTATMVAFTTLTNGRPGYISDPVIDTAKHQIIYAHCVAANKVFGPGGIQNPYYIMNHSEDRQGASVRSIMPTGYMTTSLKANHERREIIFHQARAVANDTDDRACRTKLCAEPIGDMEKLFRFWDKWGWHRVTFYGDLKEPVYELAGALGYTVVEEA